jgi:hypothetical protein
MTGTIQILILLLIAIAVGHSAGYRRSRFGAASGVAGGKNRAGPRTALGFATCHLFIGRGDELA